MNALTAFEEYQTIGALSDREKVIRLSDRFIEVSASASKVAMLNTVAAQEGMSYGTARRMYYAWCKGGAEALADGRKRVRAKSGLDYYGEFMRYCRANRNDCMNGYRDMLRDLRAGKDFAFGTWRDCWKADFPFESVPPFCPANYTPKGMGYANLMARKNRDASAAMSLSWSRRGQFDALAHTLPVIRTRVGLHCGEVVQADDVWHNIDVFQAGVKGTFNPLEFAFYDVASGYKVVSAIKPRLLTVDPKTGKETRDNLKEFQFRMAVAFLMCCQGFYKGGITLVGERGTTRLNETVLRRIAGVPGYGKLFRFQTSGVKNTPAFKHDFMGNAGGNPRMKSLCECAHNILHNATAGLLGNHGRDAAHNNENLANVVKYSEDMLEQARRIDPAIIPLLQLPILDFATYMKYFYAIEDEVMDRTEHRMEGWDQNYVMEYRLSKDAPWRPVKELADMTQEQATAVAAVLSTDKAGLMRQRKMSRREVWKAGQKDLERWPLRDMPAFLDPRDMREATVRANGCIEFTDALYYAGQLKRYVAQYEDAHGVTVRLAPGQKVKFFWNPLGTLDRHIWIANEEGDVLGMAPLLKTAAWNDEHSIKVAMGQQLAQTAELMAETRAADAQGAAKRLAAKEINRALIEGAKKAAAQPVTFGGEEPGADFLERMNELTRN